MDEPRLCFLANERPEARAARAELTERYGHAAPEEADVVVALGGDGFMLQTLHGLLERDIPIYGMHRGTVGFLMNDFSPDDLLERIGQAEATRIHPLLMRAEDTSGTSDDALAFNEVSLLRMSRQVAKIRIMIDGKPRLDELSCDGVLVSTAAGSTAYNLSAHGPILPLDANVLALTPISAFRPRRWQGAILRHDAFVEFEILEPELRPVSATADFHEMRNVVRVTVREDRTRHMTVLFDRGHSLEERILREQFHY